MEILCKPTVTIIDPPAAAGRHPVAGDGFYIWGTYTYENGHPVPADKTHRLLTLSTPGSFTYDLTDPPTAAYAEGRWAMRVSKVPPGNQTVTVQFKDDHGHMSEKFTVDIAVAGYAKVS